MGSSSIRFKQSRIERTGITVREGKAKERLREKEREWQARVQRGHGHHQEKLHVSLPTDVPVKARACKGKGKGNERREPGPRPKGVDSAHNRPDYGVSSCFMFCFWLIWLGFFNLSEAALQRAQANFLYEKISRELSWIFRHFGWTHSDKNLTIFELAGATFKFLLSEWKQRCMDTDGSGLSGDSEVSDSELV